MADYSRNDPRIFLNLSGSYFPKPVLMREKLPTARFPAAFREGGLWMNDKSLAIKQYFKSGG